MNHRSFLTRSGLALGALIVGDEVAEAIARLTHVRKTFPSAGLDGWTHRVETGDLDVSAAVGEMSLYVRQHQFAPWVLHDTAPLHSTGQTSVTFRKPLPPTYEDAQLRTTLYVPTPTLTISASVVAA